MPSSLLKPIEPTAEDTRQATEAITRLSSGKLDTSQLPDIVAKLLPQMLSVIADGRALAVVPHDSDLTPNQAARYLNVSRPFLLRLLNEGKIPFHRVGSNKRIHLRDLKDYRVKQDEESEKALAELAAQAQEFKMGYD